MLHKHLQNSGKLLETLCTYVSDFVHTIRRTQIQLPFPVTASPMSLSGFFLSLPLVSVHEVKPESFKPAKRGSSRNKLLDADLNIDSLSSYLI
jgi:hypothetical protein